MKILTLRTHIVEVVAELERSEKIEWRLLNPETCSPEDIETVARHKIEWRYQCDECKTMVDWAIQVGETPDWESATALLCRACALRAGEAAKE